MTEAQQEAFENEIAQAALAADKAVGALKLRLSVVASHLETLARALREHPEEVTPLPEPQSPYDYRIEIAALRDGEKAIRMCADLRVFIQKAKDAEKRKVMLIYGSFASRDSAAS